ncbi:MAG TPA: hypothetical protein VHA37_08255 [Candidatus Saccharimonadales bacterium]|nr:hypothetical protein [Candidatus Saccharimonadales bacterium]
MNFVRLLDDKAGALHNKNLFLGREVSEDHPKDYNAFMQEAQERKRRQKPLPAQMADFAIELQESGLDSQTADRLIHSHLKAELLAIAEAKPELAAAMFDQATADGFERVAYLEAQGRHDEAQWLRSQVQAEAPDPDYCGGGGGGQSTKTSAESGSEESESQHKLDDDECVFISKTCPKCGEKNVKTWSRKDAAGKTHYEGECGCKS